ncbi:MAG: methyltransferase domain-containing protein, partial [Bacteroidales bacterium]|nr:methyltransferase domain-containing protein [Bacteroidales bacterium]
MSDVLVCPTCKIYLSKKGKILYCKNCDLKCNINKGIYDFLGGTNSYWGEISPREMDRVLDVANVKGWKNAVKEIGFKNSDINERILSNARVDWLFHCLDLSNTSSCLNLGSGWGTNTFCLANYYDTVWSYETDRNMLEFQRIRQVQDRIKNIRFVRGDWRYLPFPKNHFDMIAADDVLCRINLNDGHKNIRKVHLDILEEIKRILKPGGCLHLGADNKFRSSPLLQKIGHNLS